jgi:hypothetical protein
MIATRLLATHERTSALTVLASLAERIGNAAFPPQAAVCGVASEPLKSTEAVRKLRRSICAKKVLLDFVNLEDQ